MKKESLAKLATELLEIRSTLQGLNPQEERIFFDRWTGNAKRAASALAYLRQSGYRILGAEVADWESSFREIYDIIYPFEAYVKWIELKTAGELVAQARGAYRHLKDELFLTQEKHPELKSSDLLNRWIKKLGYRIQDLSDYVEREVNRRG